MSGKINIRKLALFINILNIAQFICLIVLILNRILIKGRILPDNFLLESDVLLFLIVLIIIYNSYFSLREIKLFKALYQQIIIQEEAYENIERLNHSLRAQRHDFLNHIQIIYSLVEMEEHKEASTYMNNLYEDIKQLSTNLKTKHLPLNALLQAKAIESEKRGIRYRVNIESTLDRFGIPIWELCRCLGNLIDNAFDATKPFDSMSEIIINIYEDVSYYYIIIINTGEPIPKEFIRVMFRAGTTTKKSGEQQRGMGLYIVKTIIDKYGGVIECKSEEVKTRFKLIIPKDTID